MVPVDGSYLDFPDVPNLELRTLPGVGEAEGAVIVRSADGRSVILNDVVFNMDRPRDLPGLLLTSVLGSAPGPRVSRLAKLALVKDRAALKTELLGLAALPDLQRLIVSHEKIAHGPEARRALEAQLRQAQKLETLGTLAGGIAHDFNNILQALAGCSELALMRLPSDSPARRYLEGC